MRAGVLLCERCERVPAVWCLIDAPEQEGAMLFGDELLGLLLCGPCAVERAAEGSIDLVALEPAP